MRNVLGSPDLRHFFHHHPVNLQPLPEHGEEKEDQKEEGEEERRRKSRKRSPRFSMRNFEREKTQSNNLCPAAGRKRQAVVPIEDTLRPAGLTVQIKDEESQSHDSFRFSPSWYRIGHEVL